MIVIYPVLAKPSAPQTVEPNTMKIEIIGDIPDHLGHAFLQHIRDFDASRPGCHFQITVHAPEATTAEMERMLDITPGFAFRKTVPR